MNLVDKDPNSQCKKEKRDIFVLNLKRGIEDLNGKNRGTDIKKKGPDL